MVKRLFLVAALIMTCACGRTAVQERDRVLENLRSGDYAAARRIAESDRYFNQESSALVRALDIATLLYLDGMYEQSSLQFSLAKDMADQLYTKSISKTAAASVAGAALADYTGERHELTAIRFYQSLARYKMAMQADDAEQRKRNAEAAFAAVADWNAFLHQFGQSDMLARAWGAWLSTGGPAANRQRAAGFRREMDRIAKETGQDISDFTHKGNVAVIVKQGIIPPKTAAWGIVPGLGIRYEYAVVRPPRAPPKLKIAVVDSGGDIVAEKPLPLMHPLAQMAHKAYEDGKTAATAARIARLTTKGAAATTAYVLLDRAAASRTEPPDSKTALGQFAALLLFAAAVGLIEASEYADLRQWNTLPANIYLQTVKLDPGQYVARIYSGDKLVGTQKLLVLQDMPTMADIFLPGVY